MLDLVVGGTSRQLAEVDGRIEPREIFNLTVVFDHNVIDEAPATRFTSKLVGMIQGGYGLDAPLQRAVAARPAPGCPENGWT